MRRCATTLEAEMTAAEHEFLLHTILHERFRGKHLEIGTAAGGTLLRMMHCYEDACRPDFVVVDPMKYFPDQLNTVRRNLRDHQLDPERVDFRLQTSIDAFAEAAARKEQFDFMLIDGCHKVMAVMQDLRWTRLLNVGGIVCLHDYTWQHKGVFLAVNRFLASHPNYAVIGRADSLIAIRKQRPSPHPEVTRANHIYSMLLYLPLQVERKIKKHSRARRHAA